MRILVRLPNWLGDLVMSSAFVRQLSVTYPGASIDVIVKKGIDSLVSRMPGVNNIYIFDRNHYTGLRGLYKFGKEIKSTHRYDLFFSLPNSFSSAFMGWATGATNRIGFKNELRSFLLTDSFKIPKGIHRVEAYLNLLTRFSGQTAHAPEVRIEAVQRRSDYVIVNVNSEASSRRLTVAKAVDLVNEITAVTQRRLVLIGGPKEKSFIDAVYNLADGRPRIENLAGSTSLIQLTDLMAGASLVISTDSGPAHLANAVGTPTIVLFGAGNELHTAPFNRSNLEIIRLGELSCEPCEKNTCARFGIPQCLERLDGKFITSRAMQFLSDHRQ